MNHNFTWLIIADTNKHLAFSSAFVSSVRLMCQAIQLSKIKLLTPSLYLVLVPVLLCESVSVHVMCHYDIFHSRQKGTLLVCSEWSHDCRAQAQTCAPKIIKKGTKQQTSTQQAWLHKAGQSGKADTQSESRWKKKSNVYWYWRRWTMGIFVTIGMSCY